MVAATPTSARPEEARVLRRGIHLLVEIVRTQPLPAAGAIAGATVFAAASVAGTVVLGRVTDRLIIPDPAQPPTTAAALAAGAAIVGLAIVRALGVVGRRYFGIMTSRRMQVHWFVRLTDHYLAQPLGFFADQPTGKLLAHAEADAERSAFAIQPLPMSLGAVLLLVFASASLAVLDPMLLGIGLALFPSLILLNHLFTSRVTGPAARAQEQLGRVSSVAHESFEGALVVKLLGLEAVEAERMRRAAGALRDERLVIGRLRAAFEPTLEALPNLGTITLLAVGSWRVSEQVLTTGDLVQAMALFGILAFPMRVVGYLLEELPRSVVSRDRIVDVLDTDAAAGAAPVRTRRPLPDGPLGIDAVTVTAGYGAEPVLHELDLAVAPGEVVALVGATGAGKSTLCHVLAGLARPSDGQVRIGGVALEDVDPLALRQALSLVFQETFLFADTVEENLTLGEPVATDELERALAIAQAGFVHDLPEGLATLVGERGVTLSGGQRQRLALARALLRRPRVLLLDDATSAIDPSVERAILDGLRAAAGTTTLVVAHRVATIRLADRIVLLEGGRVTATGTHDQLLAEEPAYAALVHAYEVDDAAHVGADGDATGDAA